MLQAHTSHGNEQIGDPGRWRVIWCDQLRLDSESQFWDALSSREPVNRRPVRTTPARPPAGEKAPPKWLRDQLVRLAGVSQSEVYEMTEADALQRWEDFKAGHG